MIYQRWSPGVHDLIESLTCRIRVLSLNQIQQGWRQQLGPAKAVLETIELLVKAGLLQGDVWTVQASPINGRPICHWSQGNETPDLIPVHQVIQERWNHPRMPTPVVAATHRAARLFGSSTGGLPPANHRNHDLLLSEVYLRYRDALANTGVIWVGEDAMVLAERGIKNPDAFLVNKEGEVVRVIESAGKYSISQLESFHKHCESEQLAYELW